MTQVRADEVGYTAYELAAFLLEGEDVPVVLMGRHSHYGAIVQDPCLVTFKSVFNDADGQWIDRTTQAVDLLPSNGASPYSLNTAAVENRLRRSPWR